MPDSEESDMNLETKPDPDDLLLRSALATYAEPTSDSDLVDRILVRVAAESAPAPVRRWLPWDIALPVAVGLLALAFLFGSRQMHMPARDQNQVQISPRLPNATTQAHPSATLNSSEVQRAKSRVAQPRSRPILVAAKSAPLPKLDVFPTPQPPTPAERDLLAFAARAPQSERQSLIKAREQLQEPVKISAIEIQPIATPDQGGN
jgi:hypothetical protein